MINVNLCLDQKKKPRKNYFKELRILRWDYPGFMGAKCDHK